MAEIIQERRLVECVRYRRVFDRKAEPGSGYSFPCDEQGRLDFSETDATLIASGMSPEKVAASTETAQAKYLSLCDDPDFNDLGIQVERWSFWDPTIIRCQCGAQVSLESTWLNACDCGRDYDSVGNLLAPRCQWGEETGEHWCDVVNAGAGFDDGDGFFDDITDDF